MDGEAETEAADLDDEKLCLCLCGDGLPDQWYTKVRKKLTRDPARCS